jgi:glycosyltransferase involved in cell wall biosynthesis
MPSHRAGRKLSVVRLLPVLDFGGVESRVVLQSELVDRERFDFRVVAFHRPGQAAERIAAAGIPVDILGQDPSIRNLRATAVLTSYLRKVRPDVLHASIAEANLHAALAGAAARVPLRIIEEVGVPVRSQRGRILHGSVARLAHRVVGVTQATVDWLAENERIPRSRLKLIYNCGKPGYFGPTTRKPPGGRFRVFTAGRLVWQKDQVNLVKAFALAVAAGLDGELSIAGEGDLRGEIEAAIRETGTGDRVHLLGFRADVRDLLDASHLFVLPSVSEGCSVALIEAMASGIPSLASDIPGNVEVSGALGPAWLAPPADPVAGGEALVRVSRVPAPEREEAGLQGRRIAVERFSPRAYLDAVQGMYEEGRTKRR